MFVPSARGHPLRPSRRGRVIRSATKGQQFKIIGRAPADFRSKAAAQSWIGGPG